jgi:D-ribose pyranase
MKKKGILHSELARIVAGMGHGDYLMICDSGYPIPHNRPVADVVLTITIPGILDTLRVILEELHVESAIVTEEMASISPRILRGVEAALPGVPIRRIPHAELKTFAATAHNISFVRTGEATKFANMVLTAGVVF